MFHRRFVMILGLVVLHSNIALANTILKEADCEALLKQDQESIKENSTAKIAFYASLEQTEYETRRKNGTLGATFPINGLPIDASLGWDDFKERRRKIVNGTGFDANETRSWEYAKTYLSDNTVEVYRLCRQYAGARDPLGFSAKMKKIKEELVEFSIFWAPKPERQSEELPTATLTLEAPVVGLPSHDGCDEAYQHSDGDGGIKCYCTSVETDGVKGKPLKTGLEFLPNTETTFRCPRGKVEKDPVGFPKKEVAAEFNATFRLDGFSREIMSAAETPYRDEKRWLAGLAVVGNGYNRTDYGELSNYIIAAGGTFEHDEENQRSPEGLQGTVAYRYEKLGPIARLLLCELAKIDVRVEKKWGLVGLSKKTDNWVPSKYTATWKELIGRADIVLYLTDDPKLSVEPDGCENPPEHIR